MIRSVRICGLLAGASLVSVAAFAGAAAQADTSSPAESITGNFSYPPFTIQVNAQRAAGAPATATTGSFTGTLSVGGAKVGDFAGPVTCLDVEGNSAGLFYPVKSADPAVVADVPFGVLVTVTRTAAGKPLGVTFVPVPETSVKSCAPMSTTLFPITSGTLSFTPGPSSSASPTTLAITDNATFGKHGTRTGNVLATAAGMTVYTLSGDTAAHPKCTQADKCVKVWHPVTVGAGEAPTKPANVTGRLAVWHHSGIRQVTMNGHPLYTFVGDTQTGQASGAGVHSFGGTWNVIRTPASLTPTAPTAPTGPTPGSPLY